MGFFDRVKKAFGGGKKEENVTPKQAAETNQLADQTNVTDQTVSDEPTVATNPAATATNLQTPAGAAEQLAATGKTAPTPQSPDASTTPPAEPAVNPDGDTPTTGDSTAAASTETAAPASDASLKPAAVTPQTAPTNGAPAEPKAAESGSSLTQPTGTAPTVNASQAAPESAPATVSKSEADQESAQESDPVSELEAEPTGASEPETAASAPTTDTAASSSATGSVAAYDQGLSKSRHGFAARLNQFLAGFRTVDEDFFEDLEEMLIEADVGFETAMTISDQLRDEVKLQNAKTKKQVGLTIVEKMVDLYGAEGAAEDNHLHFAAPDQGPTVFLFVGVNGAGKTTTVGKLAARLKGEGQKVLLAAADTFRAGAIEQLATWARRVGVDCVTSDPGADPASVVFEAVQKAKAEHYDILLVDTAGRLQNKVNLMNELAKIKRVIVRELPQAPQEVLLVLDASTGQNALSQAKQFKETTAVTGIVLTKLDGSSKGGIVIAIRNELHLPVKLVGLGEKMTDLADFDAEKFVYGLFKGLIDDA